MSEKCAKRIFRGYNHHLCNNAALPGRKYCKSHDVPDEKFTIWSARDWSDCPDWLIAQKQRKWENAEKVADSAAENLRAAKAKREAEEGGKA